MHTMPAEQWHAHVQFFLSAMLDKRARTRLVFHCPNEGIVAVEYCDAVARQCLNQLTFGLRDPLDAAEAFQMRRPNVRYDSNPWLCNVAQFADFPQGVHSHFQNGALMRFI